MAQAGSWEIAQQSNWRGQAENGTDLVVVVLDARSESSGMDYLIKFALPVQISARIAGAIKDERKYRTRVGAKSASIHVQYASWRSQLQPLQCPYRRSAYQTRSIIWTWRGA